MRSSGGVLGARLLAVLVGLAPSLEAQTVATGDDVSLKLGGRLHAQFASSSAEEGRSADLFIRRARFTADISLSETLSGRIQVELSGSGISLKDAYARAQLNPFFVVDMGQFKRAFDPFELASSTELELVERDGRIDGLDACSGVGRICSLSRFTEELAYSERDIGFRVHGEGPDGGYDYMVTVTNGAGSNTADENDAKSAAGRFTVAVGRRTRLGANLSLHDYVGPGGGDEYAGAWGADLTYGDYRSGLHLVAGFIGGDNWLLLDDSGDPATFRTAQALVAYHHALEGNQWLQGVEPMARLSWGDPDSSADDDGGVLFTPGLFAYFQGRNRIGANLDVYAPQTGDTELSFKLMWFLHF